jgi:hypothetical protein
MSSILRLKKIKLGQTMLHHLLVLAASAPQAFQIWPLDNFAKTKNGTLV